MEKTVTIALIDYGSGNLRSAQKAFAYVANKLPHTPEIILTRDPDDVARADAIVLPGVGAFGDCASGLRILDGMEDALNDAVLKKARPFLGICVGMQLMAADSEEGAESVESAGLGWIDGTVTALMPSQKAGKNAPQTTGGELMLKIPHMGWNELRSPLSHASPSASPSAPASHPVLAGLYDSPFYFVHSYACQPSKAAHCLGLCDYGGNFAAVIGRDNMIGTQFHPEKSQQAGLALIKNFLEWRP